MSTETKHPPTLTGRWRHSSGLIFCGTLRIAKGDFDTNPRPDFCCRIFDDICRAMNTTPDLLREVETLREQNRELRSALKMCVARLEEYQDATGGTALELGRAALAKCQETT